MGRRILLDSTWMSAMAAAAPPSFQRDGFEANQTRTTYDPPVRRRDKFNPTLAAVICALILSFFLVGFAARYFKHWILGDEDTPESSDFPGRRRLSTRPRKAVETGLDPEVLSALPLVQYADLVESGKCSEDCSVCLGVFQSSDSLRLLPECAHAFHSDCIDEWFKTHSTCPLCRASLAKSAVEGASAEDHGHGVEGDVEHDGARRPATNFDVIQVVISGESSAAAAAAAASLSGLSQGVCSKEEGKWCAQQNKRLNFLDTPVVATAEDREESAQVHTASFIHAIRNCASPATKAPIRRSSSVGTSLQLRPCVIDSEGTQHHGMNFYVHVIAKNDEREKTER